LKNALLVLLAVMRCSASDGTNHDLKNKGEEFRKKMSTLAQEQCERIPRYRTDVLKTLKIKATNAQQGNLIERRVYELAIEELCKNMRKELLNFFPQSTLINDQQGRKQQAEYYFNQIYE